jgi:predicted dehydrogenase
MKFALLGWHPGALALTGAISQSPGDSLVAAAEIADEDLPVLLELAPGVRAVGDWEGLLTESIDVVIVAGHSEGVLAGARQLAADRTPIVLVPEATQGTAFVYELTLTRDDNGVPLIAAPLMQFHPLVGQLTELIADGQLGQIQLLRIERRVTGKSDGATLSTKQIDAALLEDVSLLRHLGGGYSRVTAVHSGAAVSNSDSKGERAGVLLANVALSGADLAEATWSLSAGDSQWDLTVTGSQATAQLNVDLATLSGRLQIEPDADPRSIESADAVRATGLAQLGRCVNPLGPIIDEWAELTRSFETVEATHGSLRRRRTVDLHFETTSERSIFKSQMTAGGCGLLILTLFGLFAFLLLGAVVDSRSMSQRSAEAAGRIVHENEFVSGTGRLNQSGQKHLAELSRKMARGPAPVFIMPTGSESNAEPRKSVDESRMATVIARFAQGGSPESGLFVQLAAVPHPLVQTLLSVLRIVWISPLVLFLLLQLLIFATRPSGSANQQEPDQAVRND